MIVCYWGDFCICLSLINPEATSAIKRHFCLLSFSLGHCVTDITRLSIAQLTFYTSYICLLFNFVLRQPFLVLSCKILGYSIESHAFLSFVRAVSDSAGGRFWGSLPRVLAEAGVAASMRTATTLTHSEENWPLGVLMETEEVNKKILIGFCRLTLLPLR